MRPWYPPILLLRTLLVNTGESTSLFSLIPVHAGLDIKLLLIVIPAVSLCKVCGWQMYEHLPEPTPRCSVNLYKICLKWDQIWRLQLFPLFTSNDCGTFPSETFPAHFCLCNCKNICKIVKKNVKHCSRICNRISKRIATYCSIVGCPIYPKIHPRPKIRDLLLKEQCVT